jgi:hypothetical protein
MYFYTATLKKAGFYKYTFSSLKEQKLTMLVGFKTLILIILYHFLVNKMIDKYIL